MNTFEKTGVVALVALCFIILIGMVSYSPSPPDISYEVVESKEVKRELDVALWLLLKIPITKTNYYLITNVTTRQVTYEFYNQTGEGTLLKKIGYSLEIAG